jgi:hypothetical protein
VLVACDAPGPAAVSFARTAGAGYSAYPASFGGGAALERDAALPPGGQSREDAVNDRLRSLGYF